MDLLNKIRAIAVHHTEYLYSHELNITELTDYVSY